MKNDAEQMRQAMTGASSLASLFRPPQRNLGCAILTAAVEDYLSMDEQRQASAAQFLFPTSVEFQQHYDWVTSMADGLDRAWLRETLDRMRPEWDRRRLERKLRARLERCAQQRLTA